MDSVDREPFDMVLAITTDLLVTAPAEHAARRAGLTFRSVAPGAIDGAEFDSPPVVVFLDLNVVEDVAGTVALIREKLDPLPPIIAFGPHVQAEKLQAAGDAGCTQVLTRGQFHHNAVELVARAVSERC